MSSELIELAAKIVGSCRLILVCVAPNLRFVISRSPVRVRRMAPNYQFPGLRVSLSFFAVGEDEPTPPLGSARRVFSYRCHKGIRTLMDIGNGVRIANVRSRYYTDDISSKIARGQKPASQ